MVERRAAVDGGLAAGPARPADAVGAGRPGERPIICEYKPDALWLWSQYRGTVLSITMCRCCSPSLARARRRGARVAEIPWGVTEIPPADNPLIQQLGGLNKLWEYQLSLATFILTFFTSQAYRYWRNVYFTTRAIKGASTTSAS